MPNQTGKRYVCSNCGAEMLVTKAGDGALTCCNQPMQLRAPAGGAQSGSKPAGQEAKSG